MDVYGAFPPLFYRVSWSAFSGEFSLCTRAAHGLLLSNCSQLKDCLKNVFLAKTLRV